MKVRCVNVDKSSSLLTIDKIYHVLEIHLSNALPTILPWLPLLPPTSTLIQDIWFCVLSDRGWATRYQSWRQFEIVTSTIPSCWIVRSEPVSYMHLGPAAWTQQFWERYYDEDRQARRIFQEIYHTIVAEDP